MATTPSFGSYILYEEAGSNPKLFPNSPYPRDHAPDGTIPPTRLVDDPGAPGGKRGMTHAVQAQQNNARARGRTHDARGDHAHTSASQRG